MKRISMKHVLLILLLSGSFVALAQTPPNEEQGAQPQSEEQAPEEQAPEEQAPEEQTPEEQAPEEQAPEEQAPEEKTPEEAGADSQNQAEEGGARAPEPEPIVEEAADAVEETLPPDPPQEGVSAEEEFEPGEEISEDYPVPLPSDI